MRRVLFFSYLSYDNNNYKGGSWVNSLADLLSHVDNYKIGVVYVTSNCSAQKETRNNIVYYPILRKEPILRKVYRFCLRKPDFIQEDKIVTAIIENFKPDIIQLFGLETPFGSILRNFTEIPIVVHIQGICSAIDAKWFPLGFSRMKVWWYSSLKEKITRKTSNDIYKRFIKQSAIERANYKIYNYYLGRTEWDYAVTRILSPASKYYQCNEVLRPEFYQGVWKFAENNKTVISTIMNGEIYKGFDTILQTAIILKQYNLDFEWNIYGVDEDFSLKRVFEKCVHSKFGGNNIYFKGKKNANELVTALLASTLYVHPSHIDNSPNALCEAMLLGIPCIANYVGGVPSLIKNGITGFLVPDFDVYHMAYIIMHLLNNKKQMNLISLNARKVALERHNKKDILMQLDDIYTEVLKYSNLKLNQ